MAFVAAVVAGVAALSAFNQSQQQAQASDFNATMARNDVTTANQNKLLALNDQQTQETLSRGAAIAQYGASGVSGTGSPLDVLGFAAGQGALDRLKIQYNWDQQAATGTNRANLFSSQASNYRSSALFNAATSGLRGYAGAKSMGSMFAGSTPIPGQTNVPTNDPISAMDWAG